MRVSLQHRAGRRAVVLVAAIVAALFSLPATPDTQASTYTVYTRDARRTVPFRTAGRTDLIPLEPLASIFKVTVVEDALVGGLTLRSSGQTILLIPGQSFASIGPGRIVSLPAPLQRDRGIWEVPVEFIRQALGPALGVAVDVRRERRVILVGDVRLPQVTGRVESQGANRRIVLDVSPAAPRTVTRSGNRLTVKFDAVALDFTPIGSLPAEFVTGIRVDGSSLVLTLGPSTVGFRVDDALPPTRVGIDLLGPAPPPPPAPAAAADPARPGALPGLPGAAPGTAGSALPPIDVAPPGSLRSVVIDPGHGGEDVGARGLGEAVEKDYVLRLARRLKSAIEGRIGLRVLLTRDGDDDVPLDRRASMANNNKADLFISLHANASVRPGVSGTQVLSLRLDDYRSQIDPSTNTPLPVPILGGGTRVIDVVPWDVAQVPFVDKSASIAAILEERLREQGVPLFASPVPRLPLRTLVGANMPAVMIEIGFLSNPADARALGQAERSQKIVDAILAMLNDIRRGIPPPRAAPAAAAPPR